MSTHDGVKTKVYGVKGRRIRAKERLEARLERIQDITDELELETKNLKKKKSWNEKDHSNMNVILIKLDVLGSEVTRIKSELETLKSRI